MTPTQIKRKYGGRAKRILNDIREALLKDDPKTPVSAPFVMSDDDFRLELVVGDEPDRIDISLIFCQSENWDGEAGGINFSVDVTHESGAMLGGMTPYNYSDQVWVKRSDAEAVEDRFRIIEQCDPESMVTVIKDWKARQVQRAARPPQIRTLKKSSVLACPFAILNPDHYRADESCRCNDPGHVEMKEWGYTWDETTKSWKGNSDAE